MYVDVHVKLLDLETGLEIQLRYGVFDFAAVVIHNGPLPHQGVVVLLHALQNKSRRRLHSTA